MHALAEKVSIENGLIPQSTCKGKIFILAFVLMWPILPRYAIKQFQLLK